MQKELGKLALVAGSNGCSAEKQELDMTALICSELQRLLAPTLEAAFVPFVAQFEQRMRKLEENRASEG